MNKKSDSAIFCITLDIDWAPDWVIEKVSSILIDNRIKATWFVTHESPAVNALRQRADLFELGIHPNCLPCSSHGNTEDEVLRHLKKILPKAISMRTHGLYQSSNFLIKAAKDYGIEIDVSLLLPGAHNIEPHLFKWKDVNLHRIPFFWTDDLAMFYDYYSWKLIDPKFNGSGLKIFNFHPIHIVLNNPKYISYEKLKLLHPIDEWTPDLVNKFRWEGEGPRTLFMDLVSYLNGGGILIRDLVQTDGNN